MDSILIVGGNGQDSRYLKRIYENGEYPSLSVVVNGKGGRIDPEAIHLATHYKPRVMYYMHGMTDPSQCVEQPAEAFNLNFIDFVNACEAYWRIVPEGTVFYPGSVLQFKEKDGVRHADIAKNLDFGSTHPYVASKNRAFMYLWSKQSKGFKTKYAFLHRHDSKYRPNRMIAGQICQAAVNSYWERRPSWFNFDAAFLKMNRGFAGDYARLICHLVENSDRSEAVLKIPDSDFSIKNIIDMVEIYIPGSSINYISKSSDCHVAETANLNDVYIPDGFNFTPYPHAIK